MKTLMGEFARFGSVGLLVTLLGASLIFVFYNVLDLGYWGSSATAYVLASLISYKLNKGLTFQASGSWKKHLPKFGITIATCYLIAYSMARPFIYQALKSEGLSEATRDNAALLLGIVTFTGLNFLGQKFWVFSKPRKEHSGGNHISKSS